MGAVDPPCSVLTDWRPQAESKELHQAPLKGREAHLLQLHLYPRAPCNCWVQRQLLFQTCKCPWGPFGHLV